MARINFKGKTIVANHHMTVPFCELIPNKKASVLTKGANVSLHDNLILHGDNLLALKALMPTHAGLINCVYIDPPYNTGNEGWCYNDKVANPMITEWLGQVVDREDMTRHDKWLSMMYPRLSLLYELLAEDGVIFISIDDNEVHRLRMLMDEIFGEDNFIGNIIWKKTTGDNKPSFAFVHDNTLIYGKRDSTLPRQTLTPAQRKQYTNPDNDRRGDWASGDYRCKWTKEQRPNLYYAITNPNTGEKIFPDSFTGSKRVWGNSKTEHAENEKNGLVWWGKNGKCKEPKKKRFLCEHKGVNTRSIWLEAGSNDAAGKELRNIFRTNLEKFDNPKPVSLIKSLIDLIPNRNAVVLDSFAGSGTTAHAVMELNNEDGGNRKYVLVECEKYANTITAERVRRVIKNMSSSKKPMLTEKLGGGFSYWKLGAPIKMESMLRRKVLPSYEDLARYVFYTATGEEWNPKKMKKSRHYIGDSRMLEVYLLYKPSGDFLANSALTLDMARKLPRSAAGKTRIFFAAVRHVDEDLLRILNIKYCQLPFEIYKMKEVK